MNYLVWREDESRDEAIRILAVDAAGAVEEWAEWDDRTSAEYAIVGRGDSARVFAAQDEPGSVPELFEVYGEAVPVYSASKVRA